MPQSTVNLPEDLWTVLSEQLTAERRKKMETTAQGRTERLSLVLQDIHHPHNISACMRSAEAFGVLNVDVVTRKEPFSPTSVARGVSRWLNVQTHDEIAACAQSLRKRSYCIAAAMPDPQKGSSLYELPIDRPLAVLFCNEHEGMSEDWRPYVDYFFTIPMVGMVESLNISVSAAITIHEIMRRYKREVKESILLDPSKQKALLNTWIAEQYPTNWRELYRRLSTKG